MAAAVSSRPSSIFSTTSTATSRRTINRLPKVISDEVWVSLDQERPKPLEKRFADVKKRLVTPEYYDAVQKSWDRLLVALDKMVEEIEREGPDYIPIIDFSDITPSGTIPVEKASLIKERGCCAIRNVVSPDQAITWKKSLQAYAASHPNIPVFPITDPQMWQTYWTPAQMEARTHPNMLKAQIAMSQLYTISSTDIDGQPWENPVEVDLKSQVVYADRFRIRQPGAGTDLPPHLDNGCIERWEDELYSKVYTPIWRGRWEDYDAWDMTFRADAVIDLYGGAGACSAFRSIQGWLSISNNKPNSGNLTLLPAIKLTTAYLLLRHFFPDHKTLSMDTTYFFGAEPGKAQVLDEKWHPALQMRKTLIPTPPIEPGTYVFWHCDMVHSVEEHHNGTEDSSVMYIPVVPLCAYNSLNLVEQRAAFLSGRPPPDMPAAEGVETEADHGGDRGGEKNILTVEGRKLMGLEAFDVMEDGLSEGARRAREFANEVLGFEQ